jgi:hypothetical protein
MENQQQQQLAKRITEANYILVTVNSNPTFDQLAAAIGLTLMLNKMNKYATAIFSGQIPSSLNFLNPEKTIEKTTDSLRDFIISLDKDKADKLRYKIEDNFVRIFISPYHSALSEKDFVYTMGDFNVDVVVALGITKREELDKVIIEQGRILHDATIATINTKTPSTLGTINWDNPKASSLCEMLVDLSNDFKVDKLLDGQIANSLLSGIIEETAQFSNDKTTSDTMAAGSKLLGAGANQQLVSKEVLNNNTPSPSIQAPVVAKPPEIEEPPETAPKDDAFKITHPAEPEPAEIPAPVEEKPVPKLEIAKPPEDLPPQSPMIKTEKENIAPDIEKAPVAESTNVGETDFEQPTNSEDVEQIAIAPTMNTPMMTHRSVVMGQNTPKDVPVPTPTPPPESTAPPIAPPVEVASPTPPEPVSLKPVQALNAQPVDLTKDNTVQAPEIDHTPPSVNGIDYGAGSNIEFSDPSAPPPVPPPILTK